MKKGLFLAALAFFGCQKKYAELDFFEVRLDGDTAFSAIGKAKIKAEIFNFSSEGPVDECGFFVSESLAEVDSLTWPFDLQKKVAAPPPSSGDGFFEAEIIIAPTQIFYVKAFARQGERVVFSKVAAPIGLPALIETDLAAPQILNDAAWPRGRLVGLDFLDTLQITEHGHVFSSKNQMPTVGEQDCFFKNLGPADADGSFETPLTGLDFNTDYWARAYVKSATGDYFYAKTVVPFRVRGGWRRVGDFPIDYYDGSAGVFGNIGLASFGVNLESPAHPDDYARDAWVYQPANDFWEAITPYSTISDPNYPYTNTATFVLGNLLCAVSGGFYQNGNLIEEASMLTYDFGSQAWQTLNLHPAMTLRTGAVAFSINGKGYFGLGKHRDASTNQNIDLNDFWEYDHQSNAWRQIASLPIKTNIGAAVQYAGRNEASVLADDSQVWVGGGSNAGAVLKDFWRFEPPTSPQDSGHWVTPTFFPGTAREKAVSIAVNGRFYYGLGIAFSDFWDDWWEFNPVSKTWLRKSDFAGGPRRSAMAFSMNGTGFVGTGIGPKPNITNDEVLTRDFWSYTPDKP